MAIGSLNDNAWYAYDYLQKKYGYSPAQAAGVVGNLMQESTFMTNARNKGDGRDGSDSIGIGQWNCDRGRGLQSFAATNDMDPNKLDTQLDYLHHELQTREQGSYQRLMKADNVQDATAAMIGYERPRGYSAKNPMGGDGWNNRLLWANQAYSNDRSGTAPAPVGTLGPIERGSTNPLYNSAQASAAPSSSAPTPPPAPDARDGILVKAYNKITGSDVHVPDSILGMQTNDITKGAGILGDFAKTLSQNDQDINNQIARGAARAQAGRNDNPVELTFLDFNAERKKKKGSLGGLGGYYI
jgi:hypothetical protein